MKVSVYESKFASTLTLVKSGLNQYPKNENLQEHWKVIQIKPDLPEYWMKGRLDELKDL